MHNAALKKYISATWGWDEALQRRFFTESFSTEKGKIIVADGEDAGFLWTSEKESEITLVSIRLLPEYQKRGIGTKLIKDILEKAEAKNKPVRLQVLKVNPAVNLYEKLGFRIWAETETHFQMKYSKSF